MYIHAKTKNINIHRVCKTRLHDLMQHMNIHSFIRERSQHAVFQTDYDLIPCASSAPINRAIFLHIFTEIGDPLKIDDAERMLKDFNAVDECDEVLYPLVVHKLLEI